MMPGTGWPLDHARSLNSEHRSLSERCCSDDDEADTSGAAEGNDEFELRVCRPCCATAAAAGRDEAESAASAYASHSVSSVLAAVCDNFF